MRVPRRFASIKALVVLPLAAAVVFVGAWTEHQPARTPPAPVGTVDVALIGDSLSTGYRTPGDPWTKEAQALLAARGRAVHFVSAAENGAGYVVAGAQGDTFLDEATEVVTPQSKIVMVFGSDNDLGQTGLAESAAATLAHIRSVAPSAQLVVVGPPAPPAQESDQLTDIRDVLRDATSAVGGEFVDPLALGWFQGATAADVADDSEHPNAAGEQFLAHEMARILEPVISRSLRAGPAR